ncbi:transposase [Enterococcus sp. DIV1537a]|uniref:transposase n=1 Tax=Enterococcus sp. DIV1537a TaxID=2774733 RepID=UPI003F6855BB
MKRRTFLSNYKKYDGDFKKSLVNLYYGGKTQSSLCKEYSVSQTAISRWIKLYSEVEMEPGELLIAKQVRELQKQKAALEEENLILKKRLPYSRHTPPMTKSYLLASIRTHYF